MRAMTNTMGRAPHSTTAEQRGKSVNVVAFAPFSCEKKQFENSAHFVKIMLDVCTHTRYNNTRKEVKTVGRKKKRKQKQRDRKAMTQMTIAITLLDLIASLIGLVSNLLDR